MVKLGKYDRWLLFTKAAAKEQRIEKTIPFCNTEKKKSDFKTLLSEAKKVSERCYNYWQSLKN